MIELKDFSTIEDLERNLKKHSIFVAKFRNDILLLRRAKWTPRPLSIEDVFDYICLSDSSVMGNSYADGMPLSEVANGWLDRDDPAVFIFLMIYLNLPRG